MISPNNQKLLLEKALQAAKNAYAPYSNFRVGAAILLDNNEVITGNNQENSSYGLSMCAERVALNFARANHAQAKIIAIAIASPSTECLVSPCGACRQVMTEIAMAQNSDFDVLMTGGNITKCMTTAQLMPMAFCLEK